MPVLLVQETHGHARMPEDYHNKNEPGWMEAARWLTRNARLFAKRKLSDHRYQLIQRILGELSEHVMKNCICLLPERHIAAQASRLGSEMDLKVFIMYVSLQTIHAF